MTDTPTPETLRGQLVFRAEQWERGHYGDTGLRLAAGDSSRLLRAAADALAASAQREQALREELAQSRAETEVADCCTEKKQREMEIVWQRMLNEKRRAEAAEAALDRLREALTEVRAHTSYHFADTPLLVGLLRSIERIADAALASAEARPAKEE